MLLAWAYLRTFPIKLFSDAYEVAHEAVGTFGDFIGGVLGTVFAFLASMLMYLTLKSQRELTDQTNTKQEDISRKTNDFQRQLTEQSNAAQKSLADLAHGEARLQRFNGLFFNLLNLLQSQRAELNESINAASASTQYNYFDEKMKAIYQNFNTSRNYSRAIRKAKNTYTSFYLENASYLAPFFRTLYRIMDLIHNSSIQENEKKQYAKIIRAQLRESELFFLRYNAMTPYGEKFIEYINRYRLLKHLPIMSLLEMKPYRKIMDKHKPNSYFSVNIIIHKAWKTAYTRTVFRKKYDNSQVIVLEKYGKYSLNINLSNPTKTILQLKIDPSKTNNHTYFVPFYHFTDKDFKDFLKAILQEIYRYSNFERYHDKNTNPLIFSSKIVSVVPMIVIEAEAQSSLPLRLSHSDWDKATS